MSKLFKFGETQIVIDKGASETYNLLRQFSELAGKQMIQFVNDYKKSFVTIKDVQSVSAHLGQNAINKGLDKAVDILISHNIFEYDVQSLILLNSAFEFTNRPGFCNNMQKLSAIDDQEDRSNTLKGMERSGRSKWVGGGFGVKGALKGAITAGALNTATGLIRGLGDISKDGEDSLAFSAKRNELINSSAFVHSMAMDISACIQEEIPRFLFKILDERTGSSFVQSLSKTYKSDALFNNLERMQPVQRQKALAQAISSDPHNWMFIKYAYAHANEMGVDLEDIDKIAEYCDPEEYDKKNNGSTGFVLNEFYNIDTVPFDQDMYSAEVKEVAAKYGNSPADNALIKGFLKTAIKYSLIDRNLNVVALDIDARESAYRCLVICAVQDVVNAFNGANTVGDIMKLTEMTATQKGRILLEVLSKYHLIEGDETIFTFPEYIKNEMKPRVLSSAKEYKFLLNLIDAIGTNNQIVSAIEYSTQSCEECLKYICDKFRISDSAGIIDAPLSRSEKKIQAFTRKCDMPDEDIYVLCDVTLLANGKKGFAITPSGLYHNTNGATEHWGWREFSEKPIYAMKGNLYVGEIHIIAEQAFVEKAIAALINIQENAKEQSWE